MISGTNVHMHNLHRKNPAGETRIESYPNQLQGARRRCQIATPYLPECPCRSTDSFTTLSWHLVGAGEYIFTNKCQIIFSIVYGKCRSRAKTVPQKNDKSVPESSTCFQRSRTLMADQITEAQMVFLKMCRWGDSESVEEALL